MLPKKRMQRNVDTWPESGDHFLAVQREILVRT